MPIVEKNDVDIAPLFAWSKKFQIESTNGEPLTVYIRVLGDADMGRARVASLRRSAELRRRLKDLDSDERIAYIKDIDDLTEDDLTALITVFSMRVLSDNAIRRVKTKLPKQPASDASTEAHEKYQAEVDAYPEKRRIEVRKLLDEEVDRYRTSLLTEGKEVLYKKYIEGFINELCEQELLTAFREWTCYLGAYKNPELTERFFKDFDEFANLPSNLKEQFINEYSTLELYGDDLKKLRPVTP